MSPVPHHNQDPAPAPDQNAQRATSFSNSVSSSLLAQYSPEPILELDATGTIRAANPAASAAFGRSIAAMLGQAFADLLDDGSIAKARALLAGASKPDTNIELNIALSTGQIVTAAFRAVRLEDSAAPGTLLFGQLLTVTVATTERLIGLNRRLNALFAITSATSRSLALADMIDEVLRLALLELEAQAGAVVLLEPKSGADGAATAPQFILAAQQGFEAGFATRLPELSLPPEERAAFASGKPFVISGVTDDIGLGQAHLSRPVGPLLGLVAVPLRSESRLLGWLYAVSDRYRAFGSDALDLLNTIGELLGPPVDNARLHSALLETSTQLGAVLDNIDSGVLLTDNAGVVLYANARLGQLVGADTRRWPGNRRADVLGMLISPMPEQAMSFDGDLWQSTAATERVLLRFENNVTDTGGKSSGTIEVWSDVTQLHAMNRLKDEFVAAAAHDLKTPVTAVKGYTQIALRLAQHTGDQRLIQQLEMINARSNDLTILMDTLLDMSRVQSGRLHLEIDEISVDKLVSEVVQRLDFDLRRQHRTLNLTLPDERIMVKWDCLRIERVLSNLINNAIKYSPNGGDISLVVRKHAPAEVELTVTDKGIGVPPEERQRVFERFYRVPQVISDGFRGSGLGLYICQTIVAAHGGRIWVADTPPEVVGTAMHILLPVSAQDSGTPPIHAT